MASPNKAPIYPDKPNRGVAAISTANTNRDGVTGTYTLIWTAGALGGGYYRINIKATGTTTAGMIRIFHDNGTKRLIAEISVTAITPAANIATFESVYVPTDPPENVNPSDKIYASTEKAEEFIVTVHGMDF